MRVLSLPCQRVSEYYSPTKRIRRRQEESTGDVETTESKLIGVIPGKFLNTKTMVVIVSIEKEIPHIMIK